MKFITTLNINYFILREVFVVIKAAFEIYNIQGSEWIQGVWGCFVRYVKLNFEALILRGF